MSDNGSADGAPYRLNGAGSPKLRFAPLTLSVGDWLQLEIPPPDFLVGELFSTTTRALWIGPTGLGKTNFCLTLAMAMAAGVDFLHWRCRRPCRVVYIDGEMSRRLMKTRIVDAIRRLGISIETAMRLSLTIISCEEVEDWPALNTPEGQEYFERCIIGKIPDEKPDFIFFDNIHALLEGVMKDEEPWQAVLPWIKSLTARSIGQCWLHHTGIDETHGYGTSTREFQLNVVALMERVERPDADIAFTLKFTKARERSPSNRADFEKKIIMLANNMWASESDTGKADKPAKQSAKAPQAKAPSPVGAKYYAALLDAVVASGKTRPESAGIPSVTQADWQRELVRLNLVTKETEEDDRKASNARSARISKYRLELIAADWIAANGDLVWPIRTNPQ
jgi:hypothetical protein